MSIVASVRTRLKAARVALQGVLAVGALVVCTGMSAPEPAPLALVGGTLIDGSGQAPVRNSVVLIRGDRIEKTGTVESLPVPAGYRRISTEGMTVLPGLWDPHVHLLYSGHPDLGYWFKYADRFESNTMPAAARQLLAAGVTSIRDLGAPADAVVAVRKRIESGQTQGATIFAAGPQLVSASTQGRAHQQPVKDAADAVAKTRALLDAGMNFIKVTNAETMPVEVFKAIVDTAHARGVKVTAHGRTDAEIRVGLAAGVDEFQHIGTGSPEYPADIVAMIRERMRTGPQLYWSPTVGPLLNADELAADPEFLEDASNFAGLDPALEADIRQALATNKPRAPAADNLALARRKLGQLKELGVVFVFGSDSGTFGQPAGEGTWRDLDAWVRELGLSPMAAIKWATADAAAYMGVGQDVGTVTAGKIADVIAVRGNPLQHLHVLRSPALVIQRGRQFR